jgi:hypothetical protein
MECGYEDQASEKWSGTGVALVLWGRSRRDHSVVDLEMILTNATVRLYTSLITLGNVIRTLGLRTVESLRLLVWRA